LLIYEGSPESPDDDLYDEFGMYDDFQDAAAGGMPPYWSGSTAGDDSGSDSADTELPS
jgi:hypothetical protein